MSGQEVREILLEKGVTLADVAAKLGISAQTLNSRLNAKHFKPEYLEEISLLLNISLNNSDSSNESLILIIQSQQRTIENLSEVIKNLTRHD